MADESSKSKRGETREFWEAAIRLWVESGLSVREFCSREGLAEQGFYFWRRELMRENPAPEVDEEPTVAKDGGAATNGRRPRRRRQLGASAGKNTSAVEFLPVRVVGEEVSRARAMPAGMAAAATPIEIVGASPWRVRILADFDPATLEAVLTVLEHRPC
jgi:transposase-like protein